MERREACRKFVVPTTGLSNISTFQFQGGGGEMGDRKDNFSPFLPFRFLGGGLNPDLRGGGTSHNPTHITPLKHHRGLVMLS